MKKVIAILLFLLLLTGCGKNLERKAVENYLKQYKTLDSEVLVDLENIVDKENLTEKQKDKYRDILKKQYKDLSYKIEEEEYDSDLSYVTVKIEVYDYYKAEEDANVYLQNNALEFTDDDGIYDEEKFMDYKLDKMKDMTDRVNYTVTFTVTKEKDNYVVEQLSEDDLKKIHGIYNYNLN